MSLEPGRPEMNSHRIAARRSPPLKISSASETISEARREAS